MTFPVLPNGRYDRFPPQTVTLRVGLTLVESLAVGGYVGIHKPGYIGPNDFRVCRIASDGVTVAEVPSHVDFLRDFSLLRDATESRFLDAVEVAFKVFAGTEPPTTEAVIGTRSADYVYKALKWIWAQEDVNFPIARGRQGRKMAGYRLQELVDKVSLATVIQRAEVKGTRPRPLPGVNYEKVDNALLGSWAR